jgi:methyl-accepting chemotaxis protein
MMHEPDVRPADRSDGDCLVTLDNALSAHRQWKTILQAAVNDGKVLDVETIGRDDCCDLGRWLHSKGRSLYGSKPEFTNLVNKHREFHSITGVVAGFINARTQDDAMAHLRGGSQFAFASMEVSIAIAALKAYVAGNPASLKGDTD